MRPAPNQDRDRCASIEGYAYIQTDHCSLTTDHCSSPNSKPRIAQSRASLVLHRPTHTYPPQDQNQVRAADRATPRLALACQSRGENRSKMVGCEIERPLQRILPTDHRLLWNAEDQINADVLNPTTRALCIACRASSKMCERLKRVNSLAFADCTPKLKRLTPNARKPARYCGVESSGFASKDISGSAVNENESRNAEKFL